MLPAPPAVARVPTRAALNPHGACILSSIRTARAARAAATFESLGHSLSRHRTLTRVALAALSFTILTSLTQPVSPAQAGPEADPYVPEPLLPLTLGDAIDTSAAVTIPFDAPMNPSSVADALEVIPAQAVDLAWDRSRTVLTLSPAVRWRAGARYLVVIPPSSATDDGSQLAGALRFTFTTEAAPAIAGVEVRLAGDVSPPEDPPLSGLSEVLEEPATQAGPTAMAMNGGEPLADTPTGVSSTSSIVLSFSGAMDAADVESHFRIAPDISGELSWRGQDLVFTPIGRLASGMRYTINLSGAHDQRGNSLRAGSSVSFVIADRARLSRTSPKRDADGVEAAYVQMWFSRPMRIDETNAAFSLTDGVTGLPVGGLLSWNEDSTRLTYVPDRPFAAGRKFTVTISDAARDTEGNPVSARWAFTTAAGAVSRGSASSRSGSAVPPPAPATTLAGYALNQVNAARAAYGFGPLVLDAGVSAVAAAHAWDQARNGYFSHYGRDGSTREVRLARGGISFGWSGENQCYYIGMSQQATLDWCHAQFMSEPYPGVWNHIANILNPNARRMGIGIATVGDKTIITWDFTD